MKHFGMTRYRHALLVVACLFAVLLWRLHAQPTSGSLATSGVYLRTGIQVSPMDIDVQKSDLIVRAVVTRAQSRQVADNGLIVTDVEFQPVYVLRGQVTGPLTVTVMGGVNDATGLGLVSSHSVPFDLHEHVVLFLRETEDGYALVNGRASRLTVDGQRIHSRAVGIDSSLAEFYATLARHGSANGVRVPEDWQAREDATPRVAVVRPASFVYDGLRWEGDHPMVPFALNLNSSRIAGGDGGTADDFREAIVAAAETWSLVDTAAFTFNYAGETDDMELAYNGTNAIYFSPDLEDGILGITLYWYNVRTGYIVEVDTAFNDRVNLDATGAPEDAEIDLGSVALHELGHWLSLGHDTHANAVMYATLRTGELARTLHANDRSGISYIYPCTLDDCSTGTPSPTATPVPQETPIVTPGADPTTTPSDGSETTDTVRVYADEAAEATFDTTDGMQVHITIPAGSVDQETHISFGPPTRIPDMDRYIYIGHGFQLRASVAGTQIPSFTLNNPARLTLEFGRTVRANAVDNELILLRYEDASDWWVDASCPQSAHNDAVDAAEYQVCELGEYAVVTLATAADDDGKVFLPLMRTRP